MNNKRLLLKKLYDYPNLNNNDYILLLNKKNSILNKINSDSNNSNHLNELNELNEIDSKLDLFREKYLIMDMIKIPSSYSTPIF